MRIKKIRKYGFGLFCFFVALTLHSQESFNLLWSKPLDENSTWDIDQAGVLYVFSDQNLSKYDISGKLVLTQSTKSLGQIAKIDAGNWLKIALFSEEQQQVCYVDNALGIQGDCIDLTSLGIALAQQIATSNQTDRLWVFDQLNSELHLITLRTYQKQTIQNLRGLVDLGNLLQLHEFENRLYLFDDRGQVTTFDAFGSFINSITLPTANSIQAVDKGIFYSDSTRIFATATDETEKQLFFTFTNEGEKIERFSIIGNRLVVSSKKMVYCYGF